MEGSAPRKKGGRADCAGDWGEGELGGEGCSLGLSLISGTLGEWVGLEGGEGDGGDGGVCRWRGWACKEGRFRGEWVGDRGTGLGVPTELVLPASVLIWGRDFSKWFSRRAPRVLSIPGQLRSRLCTSCMHWMYPLPYLCRDSNPVPGPWLPPENQSKIEAWEWFYPM